MRGLDRRYLTPTMTASEYRAALDADGGVRDEMRVVPMQVRAAGGLRLEARAIVFDTPSVDMGGWREIIKRGALRQLLAAGPDVRLLINHDGIPLARTKSGTLTLTEKPEGLDVAADLPDTQAARDLVVSIERGDIDQCSFCFRVAIGGAEWEEDPDTGGDLRIVHKIARLTEVSIVTFPAYEETSAAVKRGQDDSQQEDAADREPTAAPDAAEDRNADLDATSPAAGVAAHVVAARRARIDLLSR